MGLFGAIKKATKAVTKFSTNSLKGKFPGLGGKPEEKKKPNQAPEMIRRESGPAKAFGNFKKNVKAQQRF